MKIAGLMCAVSVVAASVVAAGVKMTTGPIPFVKKSDTNIVAKAGPMQLPEPFEILTDQTQARIAMQMNRADLVVRARSVCMDKDGSALGVKALDKSLGVEGKLYEYALVLRVDTVFAMVPSMDSAEDYLIVTNRIKPDIWPLARPKSRMQPLNKNRPLEVLSNETLIVVLQHIACVGLSHRSYGIYPEVEYVLFLRRLAIPDDYARTQGIPRQAVYVPVYGPDSVFRMADIQGTPFEDFLLYFAEQDPAKEAARKADIDRIATEHLGVLRRMLGTGDTNEVYTIIAKTAEAMADAPDADMHRKEMMESKSTLMQEAAAGLLPKRFKTVKAVSIPR